MKISMTATARGTGSGPTMTELRRFAEAVKGEASVTVRTEEADRPGELSGWTLEATWDIETRPRPKSALRSQPGHDLREG